MTAPRPPALQPYGRSAKELEHGSSGVEPLGATFDGAGADVDLTGTVTVLAFAPITGHIVRVRVGGIGGPGGVTFGIKACSAASYPAGLADITGGNDVVVVGADTYEDIVLTGWSPLLTDGDHVVFELKGVIDFEQVSIVLYMVPGPVPVP